MRTWFVLFVEFIIRRQHKRCSLEKEVIFWGSGGMQVSVWNDILLQCQLNIMLKICFVLLGRCYISFVKWITRSCPRRRKRCFNPDNPIANWLILQTLEGSLDTYILILPLLPVSVFLKYFSDNIILRLVILLWITEAASFKSWHLARNVDAWKQCFLAIPQYNIPHHSKTISRDNLSG